MALTRLVSETTVARGTRDAPGRLELVRDPWVEELLECSEAMEEVRRELLGWQPQHASAGAGGRERTEALLHEHIVVAFRAAASRIDAWGGSAEPLHLRSRLLSASLGAELQLTGVCLELAVRLRLAHSQLPSPEALTDIAGVGSTAAATGSAIVRRVVAHPRGPLAHDVDAARRGLNLVQVLHRLVQSQFPDPDID